MVVREREPTPAKSGKIRICLDPSQTLSKAIRRPKYIIPTLEENLHKLHGMKYMTVIDVKEAFQNIPLTVKSSLMTTMFTLWGRYRWTRLPFGISSASEEWQLRIHMVLEGLQVISIADDILVPGCGPTDTEARIDHDRKLIAVLQSFEQHHVKLNVSKMKFLVRKANLHGSCDHYRWPSAQPSHRSSSGDHAHSKRQTSRPQIPGGHQLPQQVLSTTKQRHTTSA